MNSLCRKNINWIQEGPQSGTTAGRPMALWHLRKCVSSSNKTSSYVDCVTPSLTCLEFHSGFRISRALPCGLYFSRRNCRQLICNNWRRRIFRARHFLWKPVCVLPGTTLMVVILDGAQNKPIAFIIASRTFLPCATRFPILFCMTGF